MRVLAAAAAVLCGALACTQTLSSYRQDGEQRFRHRERGYTVAAPGLDAEAGWRRVEVEGVDLGYRRVSPRGTSSLVMLADCSGTAASPGTLARSFRIGVGEVELVQAGPIAHLGHPGWSQRFRTVLDDVPVEVKAVTIQVRRCTYDWVMITPDAPEALEAAFDRWWASFEPPEAPERAAPAEGDRAG